MKYFKLISAENRSGFPQVEFTEIDEERWETRKVGVFSGPTYGYAHLDQGRVIEVGGVGLSDKPWHSELDHEKWLLANPQFEESKITKDDFEMAWRKAIEYWKTK